MSEHDPRLVEIYALRSALDGARYEAEQHAAEVARLRQKIEWVLTDAVYTAPEDHERRARQYAVLGAALSGEDRA